MRRTRRHKLVQVSIFFIIYLIFHVYSAKLEIKDGSTIEDDSNQLNTSVRPTEETNEFARETVEVHATLRPRRNCTPPAIEQV